jgi:membrane protein DedA with SNARE-associated domain
MTATLHRTHVDDPERWKAPLLVLAAVRGILGIVAIPLAPFLYREHAAVLVLLRPTKDVFLFAGFLIAAHRVAPPVVVVAALPILLGGVWLFYGLGRAFEDEIHHADLPGLAGRLLPTKRIRTLTGAVDDGGPRLVALGRFASFPSSLVAAAAGAGTMEGRRFFLADALGAVGSMALALAAGYFLGEARDQAGPWFTGLGVAALAAMAVLLGRRLKAQSSEKR